MRILLVILLPTAYLCAEPPNYTVNEGTGSVEPPTDHHYIPRHGAWSNVSIEESIPCDLQRTPLQIKTEGGLTGEKEVKVHVSFVGGGQQDLTIKLKNEPGVLVTECTEVPIPLENVTHLVNTDVIVWTLSKNETSLTILTNNVLSLIYHYNKSPTAEACSSYWNRSTTTVTFRSTDNASQEERLKPENCTAIPSSWHQHIRPDKTFPVIFGTVVGVDCRQGYWNIGDRSITCNTNLYSDFEYKKMPWCLGVHATGSEVMSGATTTLTCKLDNIPVSGPGEYKIGWSINGTTTQDGVKTGEIVEGVQTSTLTVEKAASYHNYKCYLDGHEDCSTKVKINIFTMDDVSKDTRVGVPTVLGCFVKNISGIPNHPKIVWKQGDKVITTNDAYTVTSKVMPDMVESFLEVKSPKGNNKFTCQVTSGRFPDSPPAIHTVSLYTYTLSSECIHRDKDKAIVACRVEGVEDEMRIRWFKEGQEISGALQSFEGGTQRSILLLEPATIDDETYTCSVQSIVRPESTPNDIMVNLAAIKAAPSQDSLLSSPIIWCLAVVAATLCGAVTALTVVIVRMKRKVHKVNLRLSTREKLDSVSGRPDTMSIVRNRVARPQSTDIESLRKTLDRKSPPAMSEINDNSFEGAASAI